MTAAFGRWTVMRRITSDYPGVGDPIWIWATAQQRYPRVVSASETSKGDADVTRNWIIEWLNLARIRKIRENQSFVRSIG